MRIAAKSTFLWGTSERSSGWDEWESGRKSRAGDIRRLLKTFEAGDLGKQSELSFVKTLLTAKVTLSLVTVKVSSGHFSFSLGRLATTQPHSLRFNKG